MGTGARRAVVGLVVLALAAGCGGSTPEHAPTDVAVYDPSGGPGGFAALLAGTLERVDGCVVVRDDGTGGAVAGAADSVPVFPRGVHWDGDALVVGGTSYRLGDHVELGGGVLAEPGASASLAADVPPACAGRLLWLLSGL